MPDDQKDRFGNKLRDAEKAREDQYFAEKDKALVEKLKKAKQGEGEAEIKTTASMRCPKCGTKLTEKVFHQVTVDECSSCGGFWLDKGEFETIANREREGWFGRFLRSRA